MKKFILFVSALLILLGPATASFAAVAPGTGGAGGTAAAASTVSPADWSLSPDAARPAPLADWNGFIDTDGKVIPPAKDKQRLIFKLAGNYYTFYLAGFVDSSKWQTFSDTLHFKHPSDVYVFTATDPAVSQYSILLTRTCGVLNCGNFLGSTAYRAWVATGTSPNFTKVDLSNGKSDGALLDGNDLGADKGKAKPIGAWLDAYTTYNENKGGFQVGGSGIDQQALLDAGLEKNEISLTAGIENAVFGKIFDLIGGMARAAIGAAQESVKQNGIFDPATASGGDLQSAWKLVRDIADGFFLIILLFIAFANVSRFNIEYYALRSLLPKFVAAVVLVNLGFLLGILIIDVANILTKAFLTLSFATIKGDVDPVFHGLSSIAQSGTVTVTTLIIVIIAFLAAILLWFLLIVRIAMLSVLLIIAPMAFVSNVLPATAGFFRWWWNQFIKFAMMAPIIAFVLKIGQVLSQAPATPPLYMGPLLAAFSVILAVILATMFGGKLMGAASAYVSGASGLAARGAARTTGLSAARGRLAERREQRQALRGARLTDSLGAVSGGRAGTRGARLSEDSFQRGKMEKAYQDTGPDTWRQLADSRNRQQAAVGAKLLAGAGLSSIRRRDARGRVMRRPDGSIDYDSTAAGVSEMINSGLASGRMTEAGAASAIDSAVRYDPTTVRHLGASIARVRRRGYLGSGRFNSVSDATRRIDEDNIGGIAAGAFDDPDATPHLPVSSDEAVDAITERQLAGLVSENGQEYARRFYSQHRAAGTNHEDALGLTHTEMVRLARLANRGGLRHLNRQAGQKVLERRILAKGPGTAGPVWEASERPAPPPAGPTRIPVGALPGPSRARVVPRPAAIGPTSTPRAIGRASGQRALPAAGQSLASTDPSRTAPTPPPSETRPEDFQAGGRYAPPPVTATTGESTPAAPAPAASAAADSSAASVGAAPARTGGSVSVGLAADGSSVASAPSAPAPAPTGRPRTSTTTSFEQAYGGLTREDVLSIQKEVVPQIRGLKPVEQQARILEAIRARNGNFDQYIGGSASRARIIATRLISQTGRMK